MTDIVERLRLEAKYQGSDRWMLQEAANEIERLHVEIRELKHIVGPEGENALLRADNARLRAAIRWALGEAPDANGEWFGDAKPPLEAKYWWRQNLRAVLEPKP